MSDLYGKFMVQRVDERDRIGSDKQDARYFVLDYVHDCFARLALWHYATHIAVAKPQLSDDLYRELKDTFTLHREHCGQGCARI